MAHMDVVTAQASDWTRPPFTFGETDGFYYGRGVEDNKAGVAAIVSTFIRWKRAGWAPNRSTPAATAQFHAPIMPSTNSRPGYRRSVRFSFPFD